MTWGDAVQAEYRVLGPLEVLLDGEPVTVPAGRSQALLAALLLRANQFVPVDELVDLGRYPSPARSRQGRFADGRAATAGRAGLRVARLGLGAQAEAAWQRTAAIQRGLDGAAAEEIAVALAALE
ncbi:hypothetical protein ABZ345_38475 [Lentzea sp. NPDC005914]|uniref:hypothetical protein n=1 Tax=Lentzea sp. NPDC005914 TaxID=3154572 RepID=UPI0033EA3E40